jgi:hypothetical protein
VVIASIAAIAVPLVTLGTARPAPVQGINTSAIAEASLVEKSVNINPTPVATVVGGNGRGTLESRAAYAVRTVEIKRRTLRLLVDWVRPFFDNRAVES